MYKLLSGRRAVDVKRISAEAVLFQNGTWYVTLPKDKQNSLPVNFSFQFEDSLITDKKQIDNYWEF